MRGFSSAVTDAMTTLVAFIVGVLILVTVHELGHFSVARWCGVAVRRFSIGFGAPIWRWQRDASSTEFVIARWPLGGYVRMVDEADDDVPDALRPFAFNRQSVGRRLAIVIAGPLANILLAIFLYASVQWLGADKALPILATPVPGSFAERSGLRAGDRVESVRLLEQAVPTSVSVADELWWEISRAVSDREPLILRVSRRDDGTMADITLDFSLMDSSESHQDDLRRLGLSGVWASPTIKRVVEGAAAERAGVRANDLVRSVDGAVVMDAQDLRWKIQSAVMPNGVAKAQLWEVDRQGERVTLNVQPDVADGSDGPVGRAGIILGGAPASVWVQAGVVEGLHWGAAQTWKIAALSFQSLWQMVWGEASAAQLSGPMSVAQAAGQSASLGLTTYLHFLAFFSVSLAVINALPIPVLDGGHVMYYLWEWVTGRAPSPAWLAHSQRVGIALIAALMVVAVSNDFARLWG
jgi:regulator of sigma E protease